MGEHIRNRKFTIIMLWVMGCGLWGSMLGCARLKDAGKCFLGSSTRELEEGRDKAIKIAVEGDYQENFEKVEKILKQRNSYIYAKDRQKKMIAIYLSETDTTPAGIFFTEIDARHTQIEVASPSTYARELIAEYLKSAFAGKEDEDEKEGLDSQ